MPLASFKLIEKKLLTDDVYEMIFQTQSDFDFKYGQFITFILPNIGGRAYSVLEKNGNNYTLIIKKRELELGGRGGSKYICEGEVGDEFQGVGPAGHFVLKETNNNKLFLGTGTGFVPLYNQIIGSLRKEQKCKLKLIFGVRNKSDLFYTKKLEELSNKYHNFSYEIYLSNENLPEYNHGYVTNYITKTNISDFEEFYICGIPAMIDSACRLLKDLLVPEEYVFTEKY